MSGTFRKVNYSLRPSKYAERRMLRDIFRRTTPFGQTEGAQYVGMGSLWFADFVLFHRSLGIRNLVSIEEAQGAALRFADNKPFEIDLKMMSVSRALPDLDWSFRQFVWLDYDKPLANYMLRDLGTVVSNSPSGSLLAITTNVQSASELSADIDDGLDVIERFQERFADFGVPDELAEDDLLGHRFASLTEVLIRNALSNSVRAKRSEDGKSFNLYPVCQFRYSDNADMSTTVAVVVHEDDELLMGRCALHELDFIEQLGQQVDIEVPVLTARECARLDEQMPIADGAALDVGSMPPSEAQTYMRFYRHLPAFFVSEN